MLSAGLKLRITPNYFAPKVTLQDQATDPENSHMVVCGPCNFRCSFCDFWNNPCVEFKDLDMALFDKTVRYLMEHGARFKFTGGEPTLNRHLALMLKVVKRYGGIVFLDSNGSRPKIIRELVDDGLVDVLGVSLKGLSVDEACQTAGVLNPRLAWYNPLETIGEISRSAPQVKLLVTYVFTHPFRMEKLLRFASLLDAFGPSVILKVNNLLPNFRNGHLLPVCQERLEDAVKHLIEIEPKWAGRVVLINTPDAITKGEAIIHF